EVLPITLALGAAHSEGSLIELLNLPSLINAGELIDTAAGRWKKWLSLPEGPARADTPLYNRSLLAINIMSDETSGGSVAAPEFDSSYAASGGYGYCWPRDGMFVAVALDEAGYHLKAEKFYSFAARVQKEDGSWHQRYFVNGDWAPTWGAQIDQAGAILWGYRHHYNLTKDSAFLKAVWPSARSGANYLVKSIWPNGLQMPAMDIWEDEFAQSTYSSAAVYGGLRAAAELASLAGDALSAELWSKTAESLRKSIINLLWSDETGSFIKSCNRRVSQWDYDRENAISADKRLDIAVLGICFPFGVLPPGDKMMASSAEAIEKGLKNGKVGGLHRYGGDCYAGGNPWVLAALWMSIYKSLLGQRESALEYLEWVHANAAPTGLLPEQVHRENGGPAWVLPLNWSHAMYVLASLALKGKLSVIIE
ncbi:MAG: glycoside hydrolase family 15 protein, partial [Desulfocucumaceae bacterium]